jgi:hypothetical protein
VSDEPQLSNIREHLGWLIGRTIVEVTAGDPKAFPDHDPEDEWTVVLHLDNGGTLEIPVSDDGLTCNDPDRPDDAEDDDGE